MKIKIREYSEFEYIIKCDTYNDRRYLEALLINSYISDLKSDCNTILISKGLIGCIISSLINSNTQFVIEI